MTFQFFLVVVVVVRQGSTGSGAEQVADSPFGGVFHGFLPGLVPTASGVEQLVDSSSGGLQNFLADMSPDSVLRSRTSTPQLRVSVPVAHGVLGSRISTFLFLAHALMVVFKGFFSRTEFHTACCGAER